MLSARQARIAALIVPSLCVAIVTLNARGGMIESAGQILIAMWVTALGALLVLALDARDGATQRSLAIGDRRARETVWARIDVLTSSGAALISTGGAAIIVSSITGWASLSVVGVLGMGTVYLAVIWNAVVAGGEQPWRRATIIRTLVPERPIEGERLREELRLTDLAIPAGMRLFISGRTMRHGALSRYVVDSTGSGAELELTSELGPAMRGEHRSVLELWLGDVLGVTRTPVFQRGEVTLTVLPRVMRVDGVRALVGAGGDAATALPTQVIPTEGSFRIREYADGDDARRIHWVRSAQQDRLIVRLPDELPLADPAVRLILDNELSGTEDLTCRAPDEMLDALVRVWLGIGKELADSGSCVTLVAGVTSGDTIVPVERTLVARSPREAAMQLGARATWQSVLPLASLVRTGPSRQIIVSTRRRRVRRTAALAWVVVPEAAWTTDEGTLPRDPLITNAYPLGAHDNRPTRRELELARARTRAHDRTMFSQVLCWTKWERFSGDHVAWPDRGRARLKVIP